MKSELDIVLEKLEREVMQELDDGSHYEKLKRHLELQLIKYLNKYIKKDFNMDFVFHTIKKTLKDQMEITRMVGKRVVGLSNGTVFKELTGTYKDGKKISD